MLSELNDRYREVLRSVVDSYLEHGTPVGSKIITQTVTENLSPATIRSVMADLEKLGLLYAPHTSAGRMPTQSGLRLFVDGLMEVQPIQMRDIQAIDGLADHRDHTDKDLFEKASGLLSNMSRCASIVTAPKRNKTLRQIEFVQIAPGRALIVLVGEDGMVENRVMDIPLDTSSSTLSMAANFLNTRIHGRTLADIRSEVSEEIQSHQSDLDIMTAELVEQGLAHSVTGDNHGADEGIFVVKGQANLLDMATIDDMEHIRQLFDALENRKTMLSLLDSIGDADGMQIFIGSENKAFSHAGLSMVISPYKDKQEQIVGAIGVIGPTRLNYGRIVPIVDYTSQILSRLVG